MNRKVLVALGVFVVSIFATISIASVSGVLAKTTKGHGSAQIHQWAKSNKPHTPKKRISSGSVLASAQKRINQQTLKNRKHVSPEDVLRKISTSKALQSRPK